MKEAIPAGKEVRRPLPRFVVPLVVGIVIAIFAIVALLAVFSGHTTRSKQDTGTVGRVGQTDRTSRLPGRAPGGGISPRSGGTTP